jgi:carbamate kinase
MSAVNGKLAVVGIGGNALIRSQAHLSIQDQYVMVQELSEHLAGILEEGWNLLVVHGTGPQVGFILRRSELAINEVTPVPMDYAGADLQGGMGYMFVKALNNAFRRRKIGREPIAVLTLTLVDRDDPAFDRPSKPVGSVMTKENAADLAARCGWIVEEDVGRGWRRLVPSPKPRAIIEIESIRHLVEAGYVVIACGGGGIPVIRNAEGDLEGVEAVVDKDLSCSILARELKADLLILPTSVERVAVNFSTPEQRWLDLITVSEARTYCAQGQFAEGSMEPKVRALVEFVEQAGGIGVITSISCMTEALRGEAGTRVLPG